MTELTLIQTIPSGKLRITITFLEMTARPTRPTPAAPCDRLCLLRADKPTLSFYRYLYNTVGEPWLWADRRRMDDGLLASIIHNPSTEIYVLYVGGVPAGFAELDRRREPLVDLSYLGLMPEFIGARLGSYLLRCAVDAAWAGGAHRITVNTCSLDHPKALATYQKVGFVPYRQETRIVPDPRVEGLIPVHIAPEHPIITH